MRKTVLVLLLAITLLTLLSTGTLAIYTQTVELRGQISTRVLILKANEKTVSYDLSLDGLALAPGESAKDLYRFTLTNATDASSICDYDMTVSICSQGMAQAISAMDGLVFRLYDAADENGSPIATVTSGELSLGGIRFKMGVRKTAEYLLTAQWQDSGGSAGQTAAAAGKAQYPVKLVVTAEATN